LGEFIYYRTYSRWLPDEGRRETWWESVNRYINFIATLIPSDEELLQEISAAIFNLEVMPSMRLLWSAGPAVEATNAAAYNCSYIAPRAWRDFGEVIFLLMNGTGVGFTVEADVVKDLPEIHPRRDEAEDPGDHVIEDSKEGWATALVVGLSTWADGYDIIFDYSKLRPSGARLRTMGGRSSGPEPLRGLLEFARRTVQGAEGRRLKSIEVHDIICRCGDVVQMGGVRRSALISLSDLADTDHRHAKDGAFYNSTPWRAVANNSAIYNDRPSDLEFMDEWAALVRSGSGERGIFNRGALEFQFPETREVVPTMGSNPCGEIILREKEFCNLTEVVARHDDTKKSLRRKVELAAIMGTIQSTLTDFTYLSGTWRANCEEERLLGVSITGIWDCPLLSDTKFLWSLREIVRKTNKRFAKTLGVESSVARTTVKPSGTVSQLVNSSSGLHPRFSPFYVRRVRISASDPLFEEMVAQGVPAFPEVGQEASSATTWVLEFPVASPRSRYHKDSVTALYQLKRWLEFKTYYTDHNPSTTVYVGEDEWMAVGAWVLKNWNQVGGLSFLPRTDHVYSLAPYEETSLDDYEARMADLTNLDFSTILREEVESDTGEIGCSGEVCELKGVTNGELD
jgi:ribonucleoside-diphosphate reductase alpha chain